MASAVGYIGTYYNSVSQNFSLANSFCLRKISTDPHILYHIHIVSYEGRYFKLKMSVSGELILDRLINTSTIRDNAVYDFTLIITIVLRFVGTGRFVIRYSNIRTK